MSKMLDQSEIEKLIEKGSQLVRPGLEDHWREFVTSFCTPTPGSLGMTETEIVKGCLKLMEALSEGQAPQEAEKAIFEDGFGWIIGRYSVYVATHTIYFHPRGKEYLLYWKERNRPKLNIIDTDLI